jgi:hypothetical protein
VDLGAEHAGQGFDFDAAVAIASISTLGIVGCAFPAENRPCGCGLVNVSFDGVSN